MNNEDLQLLHNSQMQTFELARQNFAGLQQVVYKEIPFGTFSIRLQYNPARILSTNAKIDRQTLQNRPCFLCQHHLPAGQQGIAYGNQYHIFVNPYPIFNRHFTVPAKIHTPQQIGPHFENLLNLAFDFPGYTVFYNGPECGASAPDHFHFQMVPRNLMPLEKDVQQTALRQRLLFHFCTQKLSPGSNCNPGIRLATIVPVIHFRTTRPGRKYPFSARTHDEYTHLVRQLPVDTMYLSPEIETSPAIFRRRGRKNIIQSRMCRYGRRNHCSPERRFLQIFGPIINRPFRTGLYNS